MGRPCTEPVTGTVLTGTGSASALNNTVTMLFACVMYEPWLITIICGVLSFVGLFRRWGKGECYKMGNFTISGITFQELLLGLSYQCRQQRRRENREV